MGQPHKHAELIKAWADGAEIELMKIDGTWADADVPTWSEWCTYRIKPEPPKYPQTNMGGEELYRIFADGNLKTGLALKAVANSVIARAIEDGDVVPASMLEKVASLALEAGRKSVLYRDEKKPNGIPYESVIVEINLQEIIEKAKGGE